MFYKKFLTIIYLMCVLCITTSVSAQTDKERLRELESMVAQLQESLIKIRGEISKVKESQKVSKSMPDIKVSNGGLSIKSKDGSSFKFGGRMMFDYDFYDGVYYNGGTMDEESSEGEWRRTRLTASGSYKKDWKYKMTVNIDDQDDQADINTVYFQYDGFKPMSIKVGKFKEPFSLERLTSSKWLSTIERSLLIDALESAGGAAGQPSFGGIQLSGYHKEMSHFNWAFGLFDDGMEDSNGDDTFAVTGRLALVPHFGENHFMHLGLGYSVRDHEGAEVQVNSRFGVHTADAARQVILGETSVDNVNQVGVEAAYVRGPFSLQGEYIDVSMDGAADEMGNVAATRDLDFYGYYVQTAYTLTGETRGYKNKGAHFDKIKPDSLWGAWELLVRYEMLDTDNEISSTTDAKGAEKWLLGVNWYVNNNVKFMLNYINVEIDDFNNLVEDEGDAVSLRAQYIW